MSEPISSSNHYCVLCGNDKYSNEKLSLFRFPKDESTKEKWLSFCNIDRQNLKKDSRLCQRHFLQEDIGGGDKRRKLQRNAIPKLYLSKKKFNFLNTRLPTREVPTRKVPAREVPADVADIEDVRKIISEKQPDLLSFLDETAASTSLFQEVLRERIRKKIPQQSSKSKKKKRVPETQADNLSESAALSSQSKEIWSECIRKKILYGSAASSLVEIHPVDEGHILKTQPDNVSVLDEKAVSLSPFRKVPSEQNWEKIPYESTIPCLVEIYSDHEELISEVQPDNAWLLDESTTSLSLSPFRGVSSKKIQDTIPSESAISGLVGVNSEKNERWELSMTLSEYIKQKDMQLKEMKETIQRLENELKYRSLCVPTAETPTREKDPDRELPFRYAGDIGTPETPRRAL